MTDRHDMDGLAEIIYMEQRFLSMILQKPTPPTTTNEDNEMAKRIYVVTEKGNDKARLIEAGTQAAAIQLAIKGRFQVEPASGLQVAELMKAGIVVEPAPCGSGNEGT